MTTDKSVYRSTAIFKKVTHTDRQEGQHTLPEARPEAAADDGGGCVARAHRRASCPRADRVAARRAAVADPPLCQSVHQKGRREVGRSRPFRQRALVAAIATELMWRDLQG